MGKHVVLTTYGSLGDLHPYIAVALELKKRGHRAVIATGELHRFRVEAESIEFYPIRPDLSFFNSEQIREVIRQGMDPTRGTKYVICELVLPHLRDSYEDLLRAVYDADLLVTHPITFAGPLVAEKTGIRWVSSVLAPSSFLSAFDPPVLPTRSSENLRAFGPLFSPLINGLSFWFGKRIISDWFEPVRQLRAELGLPEGENPLFEGQHSPRLVLALFSHIFAKSQLDWPWQTRVTGFPFYDHSGSITDLPLALTEFLDAGSAPIVFTLGSAAVYDANNFYIESVIAAKQLGYRAVLLVGSELPQRLPEPLPDGIIAVDYAPYSKLFPRSAAIVHQGGIGTTAQALKAGRPMLVMPYSHDQPDNADRVERMGVARTIARSNYTAERAAAELKQLLINASYSKRATEVGRQIQTEDGVRVACDAIEARLKVPV